MAKTMRHYCERFKYHWWGRFGAAGFVTLVLYSILDKLGFKMKNKHFPIRLKGLRDPFFGRFGTSDELVFNQIFIEREYFPVTHIRDPKFIMDCGANVGYSALWFLNQYPDACILVVEPDPENFALCQKNLLPYGKRVSFVRAGIWPRETGLVVVKGEYKDGREWATQVRECRAGEKPGLRGRGIKNLLKEFDRESIDILKIDIEASEKNLFAENVEPWLGKVKNLVIELHGKECEEIFFNAMSFYDYDLSRSGELAICKNISPKVFVMQRQKKEECLVP
ncbi:MAG TPA: FkbM family methyltransferase [bacterium]|nr:FkbM family methyltransferase [bacterium]